MSTTTTNLGLTKPDGDELIDIAVWNDNMDLIDAAVGEFRDSVSQTFRFTKLNSSDITIQNGKYANLPDGYTSANMVLICGYGYDHGYESMRFTHLGSAGSIKIPVASETKTVGKLSVNASTKTITNSTGVNVTITHIYAVTVNG